MGGDREQHRPDHRQEQLIRNGQLGAFEHEESEQDGGESAGPEPSEVPHGRGPETRSDEGDGDGIMTRLIGIMPMDHTNPNETNRLDNEELMKSILDGKGRFMPAWRGILGDSDVEALVSYIRLLSQ